MAGLLYLVLLPLLSFKVCSGASPWQTMTTGSHIRGEDHDKVFLLSPDATFSCGFHELGTNALTFSIWYTTSTTNRTIVWTANPYSAESGYSPVNIYGSRISLNHDGNLILTDTNGSMVWQSRTSSGKHTTVNLLNSGNLVIKDSDNNIVWQSFHSPTDTLLPGQNLRKQHPHNLLEASSFSSRMGLLPSLQKLMEKLVALAPPVVTSFCISDPWALTAP